MKFILSLGAALFLLVTPPPPAQAETVTLNCPSSVVEGGLVAQQVGNCPASPRTDSCGSLPTSPTQQQLNAFYQCKIAASTGGNSNYCEFRDQPGRIGVRSTSPSIGVGPKGRKKFQFTIDDPDGGIYGYTLENLYIYILGGVYSSGNTARLDAGGEGWAQTSEISGIPEYSKGTVGSGRIAITKDGVEIKSCQIAIQDDDNSAYIGRRRHHPYDGTWRTTPHCTGPVNCGWD